MHVLLTRPYFQSLATKKELEASGQTVSFSPVLNISKTEYDESIIDKSASFIVTSANAALQLSMHNEIDISLPIYAVGHATAAPLLNAGFTNVYIANGDAESLIPIILENQKPAQGLITYFSGLDITEDIAEHLSKQGYEAERVIAYQATPIRHLPDNTQNLIRQKRINVVVFMSYRTAFYFTQLLQAAGLSDYLSDMDAVCMSSHVVTGLQQDLWRSIHVSDELSLSSIYATIATLAEKNATPNQEQETKHNAVVQNDFNLGSLIVNTLNENPYDAYRIIKDIQPLLDMLELKTEAFTSLDFNQEGKQNLSASALLEDTFVPMLAQAMRHSFRTFSINLIKKCKQDDKFYWNVYPSLNPYSDINMSDKENLGKEWLALFDQQLSCRFEVTFQKSNLYKILDNKLANTLFSKAFSKFHTEVIEYYSRIDRYQ